MKLSVIIPFVAEYPQILYTILNIHWELKNSGIPYEIIAVDNWCEEAANQVMWTDTCKCGHTTQFKRRHYWGKKFKKKGPNKTPIPHEEICGDKVRSYAKMHSWLTCLHYDKKLSHWQAKNLGVSKSTGDILFFIDGHCMIPRNSLVTTVNEYSTNKDKYHGTMHIPVTYFLETDNDALEYKLVANMEKCSYLYSFTKHRKHDSPYKVPCMSTCGMLMRRTIYDDLGGWPTELGVYGGGENFINFTLAVLGYSIWISPVPALHHYAEKRDYNWYYTDHKRNQIIATYMFGGEDRATTFSKNCKLDENTRKRVLQDVLDKCQDHRQSIKNKQIMEIEEWLKIWKP